MQVSWVKATAWAAMAVATAGTSALAQTATSSVQLYGIVDAGVRHTTNEGTNRDSVTRMVGGGMSQSRFGINVREDLGGGLTAIANLENRFTADDGSTPVAGQPFFAQSWVGLRSSSLGQLTLGRQYNMLFDLVTSTYASFPYSPYMEAYKPEIGMSMGARASNMLKYVAEVGPVRAALQYSFDEGNTVERLGTGISTASGFAVKTAGGYLRYSADGLSAGIGYLNTTLPGKTKVDAWTLGGSYRTGPWYVNLGYGLNKRKDAYGLNAASAIDATILSSYWSGSSNGGFLPGAAVSLTNPATLAGLVNHANKRQMFKVGFGYQITPQINLGLHYFHAKQSGSASGAYNGKANFVVGALDYAFSKRTDAYFAVDHTRVSGGAGMAVDANGARDRTGITAGIRHRF